MHFLRNIILGFIASFLIVGATYAAFDLTDAGSSLGKVTKKSGIDQKDIGKYVGNVIASALAIVGLIFLILMVYAGFKWMLSRGNEDEVTKARETIIAATIGLIVIAAGYAITRFITDQIIAKAPDTEFSGPSGQSDTVGGVGAACCIVPSTPDHCHSESDPGGLYTASMRTPKQCLSISENSASCAYGEGWEMYETETFADCLKVFECWDKLNDAKFYDYGVLSGEYANLQHCVFKKLQTFSNIKKLPFSATE